MGETKAGKQVIIVGTGAMACLFGGLLAPVSRLTLTGSWSAGITAIRSRGIALGSRSGLTPVRVHAVAWGEPVERADLALILVKSWQTEAVARQLPRLLKPGGVTLTLQNGLGNVEALGPGSCLGVTYQGATLLGPGQVEPAGNGPTWVAGPQWIAGLFDKAGITTESVNEAQADSLLWGKLAVNCGINALTAILGVRNGELLRQSDAADLMRRAANECAAVAEAGNVTLPFPDAAAKASEVARLTEHNRSSMLQDALRGAPTEVEAINGAVVRLGGRLGVPVPVNDVLYRLVLSIVRRGHEITSPPKEWTA